MGGCERVGVDAWRACGVRVGKTEDSRVLRGLCAILRVFESGMLDPEDNVVLRNGKLLAYLTCFVFLGYTSALLLL